MTRSFGIPPSRACAIAVSASETCSTARRCVEDFVPPAPMTYGLVRDASMDQVTINNSTHETSPDIGDNWHDGVPLESRELGATDHLLVAAAAPNADSPSYASRTRHPSWVLAKELESRHSNMPLLLTAGYTREAAVDL